jgi:RNA polymerase sigma-70 factor (ECF subfamily)
MPSPLEPASASANPAPLILRARAGDREALGRLLELYRNYLALLAQGQVHKRLQAKADASDIVQETFLAAGRQIAGFRGSTGAQFAAWLRQILAGLLANHVRHYMGTRQRDARLEQALARELDNTSGVLDRGLVAADNSPSRQVARRESIVELSNALASLPDDYRQVIILRHLEGLPFAAVAEQMGRSVASVQNLWVRALARLRKSIGDPS